MDEILDVKVSRSEHGGLYVLRVEIVDFRRIKVDTEADLRVASWRRLRLYRLTICVVACAKKRVKRCICPTEVCRQ